MISEFRRRAARREAGLDGDLPELRWFAEGVLMGLWGADGVRVVEGVTAGLGRADWVDGFHSALALAMRRLASRLRPAGSPL